MKINLYVRYIVLSGLIGSTALLPTNTPNEMVPDLAKPAIDAYLQSPSMVASSVAVAPLRDCLSQAQGTLQRTPGIERQQAAFYSQAMTLYITKIYNNSDYARHLSQDGRHVSEFLNISNEFNLNTEQVYTGLRLFYNKFKEADVIDDTVVSHIFESLPSELERYFPLRPNATNKPQRSSAKMVENMLLTQFTDHLTAPKTSNDMFFKNVSEKISSVLGKNSNQPIEVMRERLRNLSVRLVELLISKIMWYPQHHQGIWQSVMSMAHNIHLLCANHVITHLDDRDDAMNSLVTRFCSFVEQFGGTLPLSFYENIEHDIDNHLVFFLETDELDAGVKPKKERLREALLKAKAKAIAYESHGIMPSEATH